MHPVDPRGGGSSNGSGEVRSSASLAAARSTAPSAVSSGATLALTVSVVPLAPCASETSGTITDAGLEAGPLGALAAGRVKRETSNSDQAAPRRVPHRVRERGGGQTPPLP